MAGRRRPLTELLAMGVIAGLVAFGLAYATRPGAVTRMRAPPRPPLSTPGPVFELHPAASQLTVRSRDGLVSRDIDLTLVVDGTARPLALARGDLHAEADAVRATVSVTNGETT